MSDFRPASDRITIHDVAEGARVSTGTVSRVLNNRPGVNPRTKARVLEAMQSLGYRPDQAARELSFAQNRTIGLHVGSPVERNRPFFAQFLSHISRELRDSGFRFEEIRSRPDGMPEQIPDGLVLFGAHEADPRIPELRANSVPTVLLGRHNEVSCVAADDADGGRQVAEHLVRLGHTSFACILGGLHSQGEFDRLTGFRGGLARHGFELSNEMILDGEFTSLGAYRAMRRALERGLSVSAVFAASDEMAIGAMAAAEDHGVRVPLDLSVVGFDDMEGIAGDRLTTVRQSIADLAHSAVELLREQLAGGERRSITLPVTLIVRTSTARYWGGHEVS